MKRINRIMRLGPYIAGALALLLTVACLLVPYTARYTLAKYASTASGTGTAQVAKFSFLVGSQKYDKASGNWGAFNQSLAVSNIGTDETTPLRYWNEIAVTAGAQSTFTLPLFDHAYWGNQLLGNDDMLTVQSRNGDLVVAPGISKWFDTPIGNEHYAGEKRIEFKNNSEVTVRYKLEFDPATLPPGCLFNMDGHYALNNSSPWPDYTYINTFYISNTNWGWPWSNTRFTLLGPTILAPGDSEFLFVKLEWGFYHGDHIDPYDTAMGLQAARALKHRDEHPCTETASCPHPGHVAWPVLDPKFILTVEQVD